MLTLLSLFLSIAAHIDIDAAHADLNSNPEAVPVGPYLYYHDLNGQPYTVTSDERSFIINGSRTLLLGGSIHYPRLSIYQWKDILTKMKNDGLNHAEVYIFWNLR